MSFTSGHIRRCEKRDEKHMCFWDCIFYFLPRFPLRVRITLQTDPLKKTQRLLFSFRLNGDSVKEDHYQVLINNRLQKFIYAIAIDKLGSHWVNPRPASASRALLRLTPCHWIYLRPPHGQTSGTSSFLELTGSEYKTWERIHRGIADPRLLAIPASWGRVADLNPNWRTIWRIGSGLPRRDPLFVRLYYVCSPGCQRDMLTWRHPLLPPSTLLSKLLSKAQCWAVSSDTCNRQ